jgi:putative oxidoreductase
MLDVSPSLKWRKTMASIAQPPATSQPSAVVAAPVVFLGRLLFVLVFLMAGVTHFLKPTIGFAAAQGVPLASIVVPVSGILAALGALSVLLGYKAKMGGWLIAIFLIGVTPMHKFWGISDPTLQQMQMVMFMKNLSMLGGALLISQFGSGAWSLDSRK